MVLESGLPELVDIETLMSDYWAEVQRPWLLSNFSAAIRRTITEGENTRIAVSGAVSALLQHWDRVERPYIYQQTHWAAHGLADQVQAAQASLEAGIQAIRVPDYSLDLARIYAAVQGYGPRFEQIWEETTRNTYRAAPGSETLRGMVSALRWDVTVGSQDKKTGIFSGIFNALTPISDLSHSIFGGVGNIADFLKPFTDPGKFFVPPFQAMFKLLLGPDSLVGGLGELMKLVFGDLAGALKKFDPGGLPAEVSRVIKESNPEYEKMYVGHSPRTPAEAKGFADGWGMIGNALCTALVATQINVELLSLGQIDYCLGMIWEIPALKSWQGTLEAFRQARDEASLLIPLRQYYLAEHTPMVPPAVDLIRFAVREADLPEKQVRIPLEFMEQMKRHGFAEAWSRMYWGAHWVLPPLNVLYEMFQREIIDLKTLQIYLVYHDYLPQEHEWLVKAAYNVMPRIDLRRAWEAGLVSDAELEKRMRWTGYSPEDAKIEAATQIRVAMKAELDDLVKQHEALYIDGLTQETDLRAAYLEAGRSDRLVEVRLQALRMRKEREDRVREIKLCLDRYKRGFRTDTETAVRLRDLLVPAESINWLIVSNTPTEKKADLSLTQLGRALRYGRITPESYEEKVAAIGFDSQEVALLEAQVMQDPLADEQERLEAEILRTQTTTYRTLFAAGSIEKADLIRNLLAIGRPEELALAIADLEEAKKVKPLKEEKTAEQKALKRRVRELQGKTSREQYNRWKITVDDLTDALMSFDYDVDEARAIAGYEEIRRPKPPVPEELVEEEKRKLEVQRIRGEAARARYRARQIDYDGLVQELTIAGYHEDVAAALADLERARLPRPAMTEEEKDAAKAEARARSLRESAVRELYRTWRITEMDLAESLAALELAPGVVQAIVDLERAKRPAQPIPLAEQERRKTEAEARRLRGQIAREQYRKGLIGVTELESALVGDGYDAEIAHLIAWYEYYHKLPKPKE